MLTLDIDNSEIRILKDALAERSLNIYNDEAYNNYSKKKKIHLLKTLARIEHKLLQKCFESGFYIKTTGVSHCWWMWTTTDENHTRTKLWKEARSRWQFLT